MQASGNRLHAAGRPLNILLLSWRLPSNPRAGGAENLTERIVEWLAGRGHRVHWGGSGISRETVERSGVRYTSLGSQLGSIARARRFVARARPRPDVVVEQINTLPFFAAGYVRSVPLVTIFFQLARSVWWHEAPFPLSVLGFGLEPSYLQCYRHSDIVTISESSAADLRRFGVGRRISIIPVSVDVTAASSLLPKPMDPLRLIFVGRLTPSKRPGDAIRALALVRRQRDARLGVVGRGEDAFVRSLRMLAQREGVGEYVDMIGFVDESDKSRILDQAHLLIAPSCKEGWGLVVMEANRRGTPAVAYDVDGLRDAVRDGETGWLCAPNPEALASAVLRATGQPVRYERVRDNAWRWSQQFTWEATGAAFESVLFRAVEERAGY